MKKLLSAILVSCLLTGCSQGYNTDQKMKKLTLQNNLGEVNFDLPTYFDTSFTWLHTTECGDPCADVKYRFQNKHLPVFKETGFSFDPLKDSVCQLTIVHPKVMKPLALADSSLPAQYLFAMKKEVLAGSVNKFIYDTVIKRGDKNFAVIGYEVPDSINHTNIKILRSATAIKGNMLQFNFEMRCKNNDSIAQQFLAQSFGILEHLTITEPSK